MIRQHKPMGQRLDEIMAVLEQEADLDGLVTTTSSVIGDRVGLTPQVIKRYLKHMDNLVMFESCVMIQGSHADYTIQLKGFE